ncbi:MAG: translation initiation factor IF-3 [Methylococcales symbiont of Hymedesmia sp. n. MRB-2018]|nr:MAG: translation initiation factor IF-3 [Methylococcales symbiont of Hymedesmia sp. n. MRB-2018]
MASKRDSTHLNDDITARRVRVVGANGDKLGIVSLIDAKKLAFEANMDLVEISPNADPPVCKVMDYGKYLFEQNKKQQAAKKKQKLVLIKEIKFRPSTEEGDYQVKLRSLTKFLEEGNKTKVTVRFRGREMAHREIGMELLQRVEKDLVELGSVEQYPKFEGRQMVMVMAAKKRNKS